MIKLSILFLTLLTSSYALECNENSIYDINGSYTQICASEYLNLTTYDYTSYMALAGSLTGFVFLFVTIQFIHTIGQKR